MSKGDGTAVVEYTAPNETTLGSALRIPGLDHDAVNRAAGRPRAVLAGDGAVHVEGEGEVVAKHPAGIATSIAVLTLLMTGCAVTAQPEPEDYTGTWVLEGADGDRATEFTVSADRTYTARNIPIDLACRTGNAATGPPGCANGEDSASFSGRWKVADGDSPGIRFYFDGQLVRQGYATNGALGFYSGSLDVPRPDYLFVRSSSA
ncbi:hypothetical protein [Curtobacterium sp. MR_MD2014]|uniref:hypothetical protein n=1 Tax=Curtobacterium sp. MR_MD2014 TaxID=1561023 RepID=UPI00130E227C|nr:hypothetical protein [Curtobacterium sp. MR_MD2014]